MRRSATTVPSAVTMRTWLCFVWRSMAPYSMAGCSFAPVSACVPVERYATTRDQPAGSSHLSSRRAGRTRGRAMRSRRGVCPSAGWPGGLKRPSIGCQRDRTRTGDAQRSVGIPAHAGFDRTAPCFATHFMRQVRTLVLGRVARRLLADSRKGAQSCNPTHFPQPAQGRTLAVDGLPARSRLVRRVGPS